MSLEPGPVHEFALGAKLPVRTPLSLKDADQQKLFAELKLDAAVVVAYGLLLPKAILEAPRLVAESRAAAGDIPFPAGASRRVCGHRRGSARGGVRQLRRKSVFSAALDSMK